MSTVPTKMKLEDVWHVVDIGWSKVDWDQLMKELDVYVKWFQDFLQSGQEFPSHVEGSGGLAIPICETTTPEELYAALGEEVEYELQEHDEFWITIHHPPNPEPVVALVPKDMPGVPEKLKEMCDLCSQQLGARVGGRAGNGMFLAWILPGFSWPLHTDHDNEFEQVGTRLHIPLITNPEAIYIWGHFGDDGSEVWDIEKHLEPFQIHYTAVDVPHTVVNRHKTQPRMHLVLDVHDEQ